MTIGKVHQAKMDFAAGKLTTDSQGFLHVPGHGDIKLSSEFIAAAGNSRTAGTARERWDASVENAMVEYRGNRSKAVAMVARRQPRLRQALLVEANAGRAKQPRARQQSAKPRASASQAFREQVQELVDGGMNKLDAIKQLSRQAGLSIQPESPNYFRDRKREYFS